MSSAAKGTAAPALLAAAAAALPSVWLSAAGLPVTDWLIARQGAQQLASAQGLRVYADQPWVQMGPLSLPWALLPRPVYAFVVACLAGVVLHLLLRARPDAARAAALGAMPFGLTWSAFGWTGHADDALVITFLSGCLLAHERGRPELVGLCLGLAAASKPTAVLALPLLLLTQRRAAAVAAGTVCLAWLPFFVADPAGLLDAGAGVQVVWAGSLLDLLGLPVESPQPSWHRPVQLCLGLAVGAWLTLKRGPAQGLLVAFLVRVLTEPAPHPAYIVTLVALALCVEVTTVRRWPVATVGYAALCGLFVASHMTAETGAVRLLALCACGAAALLSDRSALVVSRQ